MLSKLCFLTAACCAASAVGFAVIGDIIGAGAASMLCVTFGFTGSVLKAGGG